MTIYLQLKSALNSIERGGRYIIGGVALAGLVLILSWKLLFPQFVAYYGSMSIPTPKVVVQSGYRVQVGGKTAYLYGDDDYFCGGQPCKVLIFEPGVKSKEVTLVIDGKSVKERWTISTSEGRTVTKRPNGDFVFEADHQ